MEEFKPVIIDSLQNILYVVCLYGAYQKLDTLPLLLHMVPLDSNLKHMCNIHECIFIRVPSKETACIDRYA